MKHLKLLITTALLTITIVSLIGCGKETIENGGPIEQELSTPDEILTPEDKESALILIEDDWTGWSAEQIPEVKHNFETINTGDVIYESWIGKLEIKKVTEDDIIIKITEGAFVEPNPNGGINLQADPLKEIKLKHGEMIEISSQTMDGGTTLTIIYNN